MLEGSKLSSDWCQNVCDWCQNDAFWGFFVTKGDLRSCGLTEIVSDCQETLKRLLCFSNEMNKIF